MQIIITATIEVEVERIEGKFSSRDDLEAQVLEAVQDALDSADPGSITGENDGEYEITAWEANAQVVEFKPKKMKR